MIAAAIDSAVAAVLTPARLGESIPIHAAWQHRKSTGDPRADHRQSRINSERWHNLAAMVRTEFAAACGWRRGHSFTPMQLARGGSIGNRDDRAWRHRGTSLAWDHVEYFRRHRIPTGIIVHVYDKPPLAACHAFAEAHGLTFRPLPWSWYYPHGTVAGLYLRRLADVIPLRRCV